MLTLLHSSVAREVCKLPLAFLRLSSDTNSEKFIFALIVAMSKTFRCERKRDETTREFQDSWTTDYLFIEWKQKPLYLLCGATLSISKAFNVKRHYDALHQPKYDKTVGKLRKDSVRKLRNSLGVQQSIFKKPIQENENAVTASYFVAENVARFSRAFTDGEFARECIQDAAKLMVPKQAHLFEKNQPFEDNHC